MALLTKGQVRVAVMQAIDDATNKRWSPANLDILITLVEDTMFQTILDTWDWFLSQSDTLALTSGNLALSSLTKRFYRIQKVTLAGVELQPKLPNEQLPQNGYYLLGGNIVTDPSQGSSNVTVTYSYLPTKFNDIVGDGTALPDYPDGHEAALIYLASAWSMTKGDAESMQQIGRIADVAVDAMLMHIARRYPIGASSRVQQVKLAIMRNPLIEVQQ